VESGARVKGEASLPKAGAEGTLDAGEHSLTEGMGHPLRPAGQSPSGLLPIWATIHLPPSLLPPPVTPSPKDEGADFRRRGYKPCDCEGEHGLALALLLPLSLPLSLLLSLLLSLPLSLQTER
jgi:hypothetical protein